MNKNKTKLNFKKPYPVVHFANPGGYNYAILMTIFISCMIISNIVAAKPVTLLGDFEFNFLIFHTQGILTDGAFFLFPLTYVLGDVISEIYGFKAMRITICTGLVILILTVLAFQIAIIMPQSNFYTNQTGFTNTLGVTWIFFIATLVGYLCGELLNSWTLVSLKKTSGEKKLWLRAILSTIIAEFVDTLVYCSIVAKPGLGIKHLAEFWQYVEFGFLWKCLIEILILPITYQVIKYLKHHEPSYYI